MCNAIHLATNYYTVITVYCLKILSHPGHGVLQYFSTITVLIRLTGAKEPAIFVLKTETELRKKKLHHRFSLVSIKKNKKINHLFK